MPGWCEFLCIMPGWCELHMSLLIRLTGLSFGFGTSARVAKSFQPRPIFVQSGVNSWVSLQTASNAPRHYTNKHNSIRVVLGQRPSAVPLTRVNPSFFNIASTHHIVGNDIINLLALLVTDIGYCYRMEDIRSARRFMMSLPTI